MQLYQMDKDLIEINKIKNISSISLEYINDSIPLLTVIYDNGKLLNMCYDDPFFYEYVTKVYDTYLKEKDNKIVDDFGRQLKVEIDDNVKKLFDTKESLKDKSIYSFYNGKCSYDDSLLFQKDNLSYIFQIIKYHLTKFFTHTNININIKDELNGYRNNYILKSKINSLDKDIRLNVHKNNENESEFILSGFFDEMRKLFLKIKFNNDDIDVEISLPDANIEATYSYTFKDNNLISKETIKKNSITIFDETKELENTNIDDYNIKNKESFSWYKLPWNSIYGIKSNKREIKDNELIESYSIYLDEVNDSLFRRERYSKIYGKNNGRKIILNEIVKQVKGLKLNDNVYLFETNFKGPQTQDGFYIKNHNGYYYYHVCESNKEIKDINEEDLIMIDKVNVIDKSNLLDESCILSLVRKEEK